MQIKILSFLLHIFTQDEMKQIQRTGNSESSFTKILGPLRDVCFGYRAEAFCVIVRRDIEKFWSLTSFEKETYFIRHS